MCFFLNLVWQWEMDQTENNCIWNTYVHLNFQNETFSIYWTVFVVFFFQDKSITEHLIIQSFLTGHSMKQCVHLWGCINMMLIFLNTVVFALERIMHGLRVMLWLHWSCFDNSSLCSVYNKCIYYDLVLLLYEIEVSVLHLNTHY